MFLRFNFTTGDAAGQNLTGKATAARVRLDRAHYAGIADFRLEANLATDKKSSHVNILRTRGKRVTAEATIPGRLTRRDHAHHARSRCSGPARSATSAACWRG